VRLIEELTFGTFELFGCLKYSREQKRQGNLSQRNSMGSDHIAAHKHSFKNHKSREQ